MTIGEKESKDCIDPYIVGLVLSTYHLFIHPIALLNTLIDTYKSLPNTVPTSQRLVVLNNIATFLFKWVSLSWVDFTLNKDLFDTLDEFVKSLTNHTGGNPDEAGISFRLSAKLSEAIKNQRLNRLSPNYLKSNSNLSSKVDTTKSLIIEFDPVTLAQHLALINQEYVSRVPTTLLLQLLLSPAKVVGGSHDPRLKPIMDYCLWIKNFSNWVFSAIYTAGTAKKRANVVKTFLKVANESTLLHDWQGMAVITATLRRPWVMFQKDLWEGVGGKYIQMFKEMDTFLDPKRYFMRYRSNLSQSQPPGVPVLCAHIYELIRLHNLLPTFTSNNSTSTHLNISKIETIFTHALVPLLTYQSSSSSPYPFKSTLSNVTPIVLSYIQSFPVWEESVVWEREMNGVDIVGTIASLSNSSSLWKRMGRMGSLRRLGMGSASNVSSVGSVGNLSNTGSSSGSSGALKNLRTKMFVVKKMTESQNNPGKNLSDTSNQEETNSSLSGSGTGTGSASGNSSPAISAQRKKGVKSLGNVMAKVDESDQDQS
ncbi:ras guanine nucleotide exchange factor domain-containing protein [Paraphysoderma sedebokerense]|nr:ras guanine nucleotide exchange factor domain-containing protein [Paraphysoderma sedebokerense]